MASQSEAEENKLFTFNTGGMGEVFTYTEELGSDMNNSYVPSDRWSEGFFIKGGCTLSA